MTYNIKPSSQFKKDLKTVRKRGYDLRLLTEVIDRLAHGEPLPARNRDHALTGNFSGCRECHIAPDWLLIYELSDMDLILYLTRTGTHSDLF